jgi:hypothetical protein
MHQDYPIQTQSTITSMAIDIQLSPIKQKKKGTRALSIKQTAELL